jgi:hypothetical protein
MLYGPGCELHVVNAAASHNAINIKPSLSLARNVQSHISIPAPFQQMQARGGCLTLSADVLMERHGRFCY